MLLNFKAIIYYQSQHTKDIMLKEIKFSDIIFIIQRYKNGFNKRLFVERNKYFFFQAKHLDKRSVANLSK